MKIEPLTNSLYLDFNGDSPPATVKGVAMTNEGNVYAVCGVAFIAGEYFIIFGVKPGFSKRKLIEGWKAFKGLLKENITYYAIIDRELKTSESLLNHFNFDKYDDDIYIYRGN